VQMVLPMAEMVGGNSSLPQSWTPSWQTYCV
jgi:hypothetical protein